MNTPVRGTPARDTRLWADEHPAGRVEPAAEAGDAVGAEPRGVVAQVGVHGRAVGQAVPGAQADPAGTRRRAGHYLRAPVNPANAQISATCFPS